MPRPRARWATRLLIPAGVLLSTGGVLAYAARDALQPRLEVYVAAAIPRVSVEVAPSTSPDAPPADGSNADSPDALGPVAVQAPGWIEPAPFAVTVPALAEGVIKAVLVLEGETITEGQVVARLIDDDARLMLRAAEATVAERQSDVQRARAALATAQSQVLTERLAADELRDEVTRKRQLVNGGSVSAGEFRGIEIRLEGMDARVVTAERLVSEAEAAVVQAESARDAALVDKDEAELRLSRMEVRSPVSGVVLARLVEPGTRISMDSGSGERGAAGAMTGAVLRVYDPAKLQVRVDVPLADAAKVNVGTRATIITEALPDQTFSGVVARVVHEANIQRNTVQFKVALDAPSHVLKPEMLTRVKLHAPAASHQAAGDASANAAAAGGGTLSGTVFLVPTAAVTSVAGDKGEVWVVDSSGRTPVARKREIATRPTPEEGFVVVTNGLRLTDRVILDPPSPPAIHDGTLLKVLGERTSSAPEPASTDP